MRETIQSIQKPAVPVRQASTPVEEATAPPEREPVINDPASSVSKTRNQVMVEKLATAALRAGISLEELIQLIDAGVTPSALIDVIEARLMVRIE